MFGNLASPITILAVALAALANIQPTAAVAFTSNVRISDITSQQIEALSPSSKSCATAKYSTECSDSTTVATHINSAYQAYKVWSLGPKAALTSLMAFESGDFQYNINHFPGRPGQGTKAMLMFKWIYKYALWAGKESEVTKILGKPAQQLTDVEVSAIANNTQNDIRALVLTDGLTFRAAPWYLTKQCTRESYEGLIYDGYEGFKNYIEKCIEAGDITEDRTAKWCTAIKTLKPADMDLPTQCPA